MLPLLLNETLTGGNLMAAPITIKKRKMSFKKADTADKRAEVPSDGDASGDLDAETADSPADFGAPPVRSQAAGPSYMLVAILATVAAVCFLILVFIQWMEWTDLNTAFPRPIDIGQIAVPPKN